MIAQTKKVGENVVMLWQPSFLIFFFNTNIYNNGFTILNPLTQFPWTLHI